MRPASAQEPSYALVYLQGAMFLRHAVLLPPCILVKLCGMGSVDFLVGISNKHAAIILRYPKIISTEPPIMMSDPMSFFTIPSSWNILYPKTMLTMVDNWNRARP